jgi:hypothetical protein
MPRASAYLSGAGVLVPAGGDGLVFAGAPSLGRPWQRFFRAGNVPAVGRRGLVGADVPLVDGQAGTGRAGSTGAPRALRSPEMAWSGVAIEALGV